MAKSIRDKMIVILVASLAFASCFTIYHEVRAGVLISPSDTMSRLRISTAANHEFAFRLTLGTNVTENETIEILFSTGFAANLGGIDCEDIDLLDDLAQLNLNTVAGGCGATATLWGASVAGGKLTLTAPSNVATYIAGSSDVIVRIGTNATYGATGNTQIINPAIPGSYIIQIGGTFGDAKNITVVIVTSEQIGVTARVGGGGIIPPPACVIPPIIFNLQVIDITQTSARIIWETNDIATTEVNYGLTSSYGSYAPGPAYVTSHSVLLTGLYFDTLYHFNVSSTNLCGLPATSVDQTFRTLGTPDVIPPEISDTRCDNITPNSFDVLWGTNEVSGSRVEHGETISYERGAVEQPGFVLYHDVPLSGLLPDTLYHFRTISADPYGNATTSGDFSCRTLEEPLCVVECERAGYYDVYIINLMPGLEERHSDNPTWSRRTDIGPDHVRFDFEDRGEDWDYNDFSVEMETSACDAVTIKGLAYNADWEHEVRLRMTYDGVVRDDILLWQHSSEAVGQTKIINVRSFTSLCEPDVTPPVIMDLRVDHITQNSAEIYWRTDEPATTVVEWGLTDSYELGTSSIMDLTIGHTIFLPGLTPDTIYHFRVISSDDSGNTTYSDDYIFRTRTDTIPPANVMDFNAEATPERTVLLTWTNPADPDFAGVVIRRSFTGYPSGPTDGEAVFDGNATTWTDINFTPADYNKPIYYSIFAYDTARNFSSGAVDQTIIEVLVTIDIKAWPEKRWPRTGNWSTRAKLDVRNLGNPAGIVQTGQVGTSDAGLGRAQFTTFPPANYDVALKGLSHLRKVLTNVPLLEEINPVDFTLGGSFYLLAGDTKYPQDDQVNSLDLSVLLNKLNTGDEISDLNRDMGVNSIDINMLIANLMKMGNP